MESKTIYEHGSRIKRQGMFSQSLDFPLHTGNRIMNKLVDRVLKIAPDAKTKYKYFGGQPRLAKIMITHPDFSINIRYEPPYSPVHGNLMTSPPAEISAELSYKSENGYDAKKCESLAEIVRKL